LNQGVTMFVVALFFFWGVGREIGGVGGGLIQDESDEWMPMISLSAERDPP
jgi:hypothetical protein